MILLRFVLYGQQYFELFYDNFKYLIVNEYKREMRISREELVLFGLDKLINHRGNRDPYTREDLANSLDISEKTLNEYLTKLSNAKLIERHQRKFIKELDVIFKITEEGAQRVKMIEESIYRMVLTPEHHNIPSCILVGHNS